MKSGWLPARQRFSFRTAAVDFPVFLCILIYCRIMFYRIQDQQHTHTYHTHNMEQNSFKRFWLRLNSVDEGRLKWLLLNTAYRSKSEVVRSAISFYERAMELRSQGYQLSYEHYDTGTRIPLSEVADSAPGEKESSCSFLELRLSEFDGNELESLVEVSGAETASSAVRESIRFYEESVKRKQAGFNFVAQLSGQEALLIPLRGPVVTIRTPEDANGSFGSSSNGAKSSKTTLEAILPNSLLVDLENLASNEGCSIESLLVDILREEIAGRARHARYQQREQATDAASFFEQRETSEKMQAYRTDDIKSTTQETPEGINVPAPLLPLSVLEGWSIVVAEHRLPE